ncbi:MAG: hypothetical protein F6K40_35660 [Okeania sp. SIO3I5]|uniref:restriction endonuclease-related protein n=1 Tax=Okeania sp. SIO3I5 TaxID=2607805 RepID=UPI0013BC6033|nr:hypothetical protein [Okeania sp. SIO3I5]NEQ41253.1 hypothetical protein [Okeania sp. SIO3I5]
MKVTPETCFDLLVTGLVDLESAYEQEGGITHPYPKNLQRALNQLALLSLRENKPIIQSLGEVLKLCKTTPLIDWPINFSQKEDICLLENIPEIKITEECQEFAQDVIESNKPGILQKEVYQKIIALTSRSKTIEEKDAIYRQVREFLAKHSITTLKERVQFNARFKAKFKANSKVLEEGIFNVVYTHSVPASKFINDKIARCKLCGSLVTMYNERMICTVHKCDFNTSQNKESLIDYIEPNETVKLAAPDIRYYLVSPTVPELKLRDRAKELKCKVTMWPGLDSYDLLIVCPDGYKLCVDVKDWVSPDGLAEKCSEKGFPMDDIKKYGIEGDEYCFVVPDARKAKTPNYKEVFIEHSNAEIYYESELIDLIKNHV